jgi:hypothetical protein
MALSGELMSAPAVMLMIATQGLGLLICPVLNGIPEGVSPVGLALAELTLLCLSVGRTAAAECMVNHLLLWFVVVSQLLIMAVFMLSAVKRVERTLPSMARHGRRQPTSSVSVARRTDTAAEVRMIGRLVGSVRML